MGHAELIEILEKLPPERQAEVLDFAQFLALRSACAGRRDGAGPGRRHPGRVARRARVLSKCAPEQLHKEFADMRSEWDGRGWEAQP